jgi:hypothetical protein
MRAQAPADTPGLNYFKNFFVTGDYVSATVDLGSQSGGNGLVTGTIQFDQPDELLPSNDADVVAAFLYWQTIVGSQGLSSDVHPTFRGFDIAPLAKEVASTPLTATFSPCWSGGGGTANTMKTFRADVRRLLPYATDANGLPVGKALINNQSFEVRLPDNGTGNQAPQTAGATLVVVYRLPTKPLRSVVLYDGLQLKPDAPTPTTTSQTLRGFYEAADSPATKLTLLVGSGAKNNTERVLVGQGRESDLIVATDPFFTKDSNSPGSDRAWDGPTFYPSLGQSDLTPAPPAPYGQQVTVRLTHTSSSPYDCLATSAMVFSTDVKDTDFDGLLDVWETGDVSANPPTHAPLLEPTGQPLPNLFAMGADKNVQDVFVEVGFMDYVTAGGYETPLGHVNPHTHLPSESVLSGIAAVFQNAAVRQNPANNAQTKSGAIKIHFDVGNRYQGNPNVIPAALARGGEEIPETKVCDVGGNCAFPGFYGVVGWKRGFQVLKEPVFDENRRHMFRWALFAHALGLPRDDDPATPANESKFPKSISGVSDAGDGGGDFLITLGLWDNSTGTEFIQKSTFVHEFGHTAGLRHGGQEATASLVSVNCKPSYLSSMNYLFQIRGLIGRTSSGQIVPTIDYSRQDLQLAAGVTGAANNDLHETDLTETALREGNTAALFPTRWYAPRAGLDNQLGISPSTRHCDGSPLGADEVSASGEPLVPMIRMDGTYPIGRIDWNASGTLDSNPLPLYSQDINYNGDATDAAFTGWNDWQHLDLRQIGARRVPGILSLEIARDDLPETDPIFGDWGYGDWGYGDWGYGDWGYGDWGYGDWGYGDWGYGDWGYGAEEEINEDQARSQGPAPNSLTFSTTNKSIILRWQPPPAGGPVAGYHVWRALAPLTSNQPADITPNGLAPAATCTAAGCSYEDSSSEKNKDYLYFVVAEFTSGQKTRSEIIPARR